MAVPSEDRLSNEQSVHLHRATMSRGFKHQGKKGWASQETHPARQTIDFGLPPLMLEGGEFPAHCVM